MQTESRHRFYLPELDGLRFIAFMLVFIHNAPQVGTSRLWTALHDYGWIGVDIFFCISAYLITILLLAEHREKNTISVRFFYVRRALRILPLYFFFIGTVYFFALVGNNTDESTIFHLSALVLFLDNFATALVSPNPLFHTVHLWSISYEEQFYFFIPWFVLCFGTKTEKVKKILFSIFLLGYIVKVILIQVYAPHPIIYVLPFTRFESILTGIALGFGFFDRILIKIKSEVILLAGIVCFGLVTKLPNIEMIGWHLILTYSLVGVGSVLIVGSITKNNSSFWSKFLRNAYLVKLGKISYGLYIYHLACLVIADIIIRLISPISSSAYPISMNITGLFLTIIFALISYRVIEKPFLRLKERFEFILSNPA